MCVNPSSRLLLIHQSEEKHSSATYAVSAFAFNKLIYRPDKFNYFGQKKKF